MLGIEDVRELIDRAEQAPPGAGGIVSMPYLSPAGERAPFLNANARGMLYGLSLEHDSTHIARALLEGLTLVLRDCLRASKAEPSELRVCGGAASRLWCQLIADVTGVPTLRTNDTELGQGAYITALRRVSAEPSVEAAVGRLVGAAATARRRARRSWPTTTSSSRRSSSTARTPRRRGDGWPSPARTVARAAARRGACPEAPDAVWVGLRPRDAGRRRSR